MSTCACERFASIGKPCHNEVFDVVLCPACQDRDCEIEAPFGGEWAHVAPVGKPRLLPDLPEFTCGVCGETFGTNYAEDEIECPCGARRCPHCHKWFGGGS